MKIFEDIDVLSTGTKVRKAIHRAAAAFFAAAMFASLSAQATIQPPQRGPKAYESIPGQFVVSLKKDRNFYGTRAIERSLQGRVIDQIRPDMLLIQRNAGEDVGSALQSLQSSPIVELVDPNYIYRIKRTPNDPEYKRLWGLNNTGEADTEGTRGMKGVDVNAERAWELQTGSKKVVVAVIDTGIDFKIADLAPNAWINQAEATGKAGVDDDANGFVDDINGYDFVNNDGDPTDDNEHGSHCAGTIGASGDDGVGVVGVSWNVSLMGLKFLDRNGSGSLANAVKAIDYGRKMGAQISSNSWGGGGPAANLKKAIEDARDAGQLFIAAAGNDGGDNDKTPSYPASFQIDNVISVAAIANRGDLAFFSNFGKTSVHIAAPGHNIVSTVPGGKNESFSGTSMAAPHVSGVAALLLSDKPELTYKDMKERMLKYARPLRALSGRIVSGGIVDAYHALTGTTPPDDPNDPAKWTSQEYKLSTPHPYPTNYSETFTIKIPNAKRLAIKFSRFELENYYDKVNFFDGSGNAIGQWSGKYDGQISPIADGDTIVIKVKADDQVNAYGFDVESVFFE